MTDRDTHFLRSAQQVTYKVLDLIPNSRDDQKLVAEIIAQYAYDLVLSIHRHDWLCPNPEETIKRDLDLTQWPESPTSPPDAQVEQAQSDD
jgi:hypothetical protein